MSSLAGAPAINLTLPVAAAQGGTGLTSLAALPPAHPMAYILSADMTLSTDQALTFNFTPALYAIRRIIAVRKSGAFGVGCLGGIYPGASKSGTPILAATQTYAALTGAGLIVDCAAANLLLTTALSAATLFLSLTTGNTGALTADVFVYVDVLAA